MPLKYTIFDIMIKPTLLRWFDQWPDITGIKLSLNFQLNFPSEYKYIYDEPPRTERTSQKAPDG